MILFCFTSQLKQLTCKNLGSLGQTVKNSYPVYALFFFKNENFFFGMLNTYSYFPPDLKLKYSCISLKLELYVISVLACIGPYQCTVYRTVISIVHLTSVQ